MLRRTIRRDQAAEVFCEVCAAVGVVNELAHERAPQGWRVDYDGRLYCPGCIRAYVRPDIEARNQAGWSK